MKKTKRYLSAENLIIVMIMAASAYMFFASFGFKKAQSRLFPIIISGLTFLCAAIGIIVNVLKTKRSNQEEAGQSETKEAVSEKATEEKVSRSFIQRIPMHYLVMLLSLIYVLIFEPLGFVISTFLALTVIPFLLGYRKWYVILPVAIVLSVGLYILFKNVFYVSLPAGILKSILN